MDRLLELLKNKGCDIDVGIERSMGREDFYLAKLRRFADCDYIEKMEQAYKEKDLNRCKLYACSLNNSYFELGLIPMYYLNSYILINSADEEYQELGEVIRQLVKYQNSFSEMVSVS